MKRKEIMEKNSSKFKLTKYLHNSRFGIAMYIITNLLATGSDIAITILAANAIEVISGANPDYKYGLTLGFFVLGFALLQNLFYWLSYIIYEKYSNRIMSELNLDLAKQAFKLNSKTYNDHDTGTFVQRIVGDPEHIVHSMVDIVDIITELVTAIVMLVYISTLNFGITLIFITAIILGLLVELVRVKLRRKNRFALRKKSDVIHSLTTEIVKSEKDIKSLGLEDRLSDVSKQSYKEYSKARIKLNLTDANIRRVRVIIVHALGYVAILLGIHYLSLAAISLGTFMLVYSNRGSLNVVCWNVGALANCFVDMRVCYDRMVALFDEKEFVTEKFGNVSLENVVGEIEFKDVSYTFKEYEWEQDTNQKFKLFGRNKRKPKTQKLVSTNQVFDKLNFKIVPNTTVAFVGKSGSGKSTILNLMSKMYEVDSGEVLIDNTNINTLDKETLRKSISLVNQFPYIFDMTIKENLLLAKGDASDDDIKDALKKASLLEFVNSLPKGIETKVGESGIKLSGGQKQRLAIARALLRKSNIIIFDESTSSLDNFAQNEVKKSIDMLKGKSTIVIVAHRLSTIRNVDKIFFLDEGKIVDSGTFEYLYDNNEKFKNMFLAENI